jgi:hypothetical protein
MAIYLRQICLVAEQLKPAIDALSHCFALPPCHIDPAVGKFGLENTLLAVGSQFIEVVAPTKSGTPAGRFLQRRGGEGGYMVICQTPSKDEQAAVRQRAQDKGVRIAYEADRDTWNIMQLHPADMGATFFEVDWDQAADVTGNWEPAGGKGWQTLDSTRAITAITGVVLQGESPKALAEHWAHVAGTSVEEEAATPVVKLANATLYFEPVRDGRGAGLSGLAVTVADRERIEAGAHARGIPIDSDQLTVCGTRFHLLPA